MTTFTKPQLQLIRKEMERALGSAALEGVTFTVGNCTYNGGEATFKVEVLLDGAETKEQKDLTQMASLHGIDTSIIKSTQGMSLSLTGYNRKARKMPWIVQDLLTSKTYKLSDRQAELFFKKPNTVEELVS
jgi:hypothetical protein